MPELPEVESVRRQLDPVLTGVRIADVNARRPDLRIPFPPRFRRRLRGQTVNAVTRRAKYLLADLSSGDTLLMHLGMSGSFRIERPGQSRQQLDLHDHVVFDLDSGARVVFNDPRRFGFMDMGIPLVKGRDISPVDTRSTEPVIMINETLARTLWPGEDPIGKIILGACSPERRVSAPARSRQIRRAASQGIVAARPTCRRSASTG